MSEFQTLLYETPAPHVARIVLNRPDTRNAQDTRLLYELNDAFDKALAHSHNMQVHGMLVDPTGISPAVKKG